MSPPADTPVPSGTTPSLPATRPLARLWLIATRDDGARGDLFEALYVLAVTCGLRQGGGVRLLTLALPVHPRRCPAGPLALLFVRKRGTVHAVPAPWPYPEVGGADQVLPFRGFAHPFKPRIPKPLSLPHLAQCCTILRSRWCQNGVNPYGHWRGRWGSASVVVRIVMHAPRYHAVPPKVWGPCPDGMNAVCRAKTR